MVRIILGLMLCICVVCGSARFPERAAGDSTGSKNVRLGNFSVSLAVKDLRASREFYEKLGFRVVGGNGRNYSILQNETSTIGLYQGMFDKNILTFNPGWDRTKATLPDYDDVREIQRTLLSRGLALTTKADELTTGPASLVLSDPDGNQILIDQHVPSPRKRGAP
jgi:catechol 2,3-dioxygenase-like lactoylglutathione lyase family enzyme